MNDVVTILATGAVLYSGYLFSRALRNKRPEYNTSGAEPNQHRPLTAVSPVKEGLIIDKVKGSIALSSYERELLRYVSATENHFFNIDQCSLETVRLYLRTLSTADYSLRKSNSSLTEEIGYLASRAARSRVKFPSDSPNFRSVQDNFVRIIYTSLFRICENTVRAKYGSARRLNTNLNTLPPDCQRAFKERLFRLVAPVMDSFAAMIEPTTQETELALNTQYAQRWKSSFASLVEHKLQEPRLFHQGLLQLLQLNPLNSAQKELLLAATDALLSKDKMLAANCYLRYLQLSPQDPIFSSSKQSAALKRGLFGNNTSRLATFESIARQLIADQQLEPALAALPSVFAPDRRRIRLDPRAVVELQEQHAGTVALLNAYLQDETVEAAPIVPAITEHPSLHQPAADPQAALLALFYNNDFSLGLQQLQVLAQQHQQMPNHLINSINERYYDLLDDNMIDFHEDSYTLHPPYFHKITSHD